MPASESGCQPLPSHSKLVSTRSWVLPLKQVVALPKQRTSLAWIATLESITDPHDPLVQCATRGVFAPPIERCSKVSTPLASG